LLQSPKIQRNTPKQLNKDNPHKTNKKSHSINPDNKKFRSDLSLYINIKEEEIASIKAHIGTFPFLMCIFHLDKSILIVFFFVIHN